MRTPIFFAALLCAAFSAGGAARAEQLGDFGRPADSPFVDEFLPWLKGGWLDLTGKAIPSAPYTDDEKMLRNRAYVILLPIEQHERSLLTLAGADFVELWNLIRDEPAVYDVRSYGDWLVARPYRSHTARYAQLIDDIRADTALVRPFFATAHRVFDADGVRRQSFRFVAPHLSGKIEIAERRVEENRRLVAEVYRRFRERIASYRYALETLLVLTPSPAAVEAEKMLYLLEERFGRVTAPEVAAADVIIRK
jgi:hypothetical protein